MEITYLGHSSFKIRGKLATIVTDPYDNDFTGLKFPKHVSADIVSISHDHKDHNEKSQIEGEFITVVGPGEYEIKGVGIIGLAVFHDSKNGQERGRNTIYRFDIDGLTIVHLGDLGHILDAEEIEHLDGVDILMVPVGGTATIDTHQAAEIIKEIEPSIVIPMHYGRPDLKFKDLRPVEDFLKEIGKEGVAPQPKLVITKDKLPEELQVVVLE